MTVTRFSSRSLSSPALTDFEQLHALRFPLIDPPEPTSFVSSIECLAVSYPSRTLLAVIHSRPSPQVLSLVKAWGTAVADEDFRPADVSDGATTPVSHQDDLPIELMSSDSFIDSEPSDSSDSFLQSLVPCPLRRSAEEDCEATHSTGRAEWPRGKKPPIFAKQSVKDLRERVATLAVDERVGVWCLSLSSFPTLSPCSRILQAKQVIIRAREQEAQGRLNEAVSLYREGFSSISV
mgnify:CR=1 FL=1